MQDLLGRDAWLCTRYVWASNISPVSISPQGSDARQCRQFLVSKMSTWSFLYPRGFCRIWVLWYCIRCVLGWNGGGGIFLPRSTLSLPLPCLLGACCELSPPPCHSEHFTSSLPVMFYCSSLRQNPAICSVVQVTGLMALTLQLWDSYQKSHLEACFMWGIFEILGDISAACKNSFSQEGWMEVTAPIISFSH